MSTVLVTGGTGTLGRHLVARLCDKHEVRVLSRRPGAGTHVGDLVTGAGLADAAAGADIIVHAASDFRSMGRVDLAQTEQLLRHATNVSHLLYVSIVGIDHIPMRYYRNKLACEDLIAKSGVPHTIQRATQFHELIAWILHTVEGWPIAPLPLDFLFQPVAAADVATHLAALVDTPPQGRAPDFGGPETQPLSQLLATWLRTHPGPRHPLNLPLPGKTAAAFRAGRNTCTPHPTQPWSEYLATTPPPAYTLRRH
ncbi:NAD-dependent epimerase/dehydratase family protein [Nocardia panacis]|uniref:NAD-dependent epimerase/dehydratase family protein n=1 Tax=Nocardia panacis TaxID=2340916 RepID=A0A3A4L293_9NOCA|nr:NAD(P)H-binding protein [Nocardia panacis]RJO76473.1 NAD-dependent epimerase/dehydratase family protein [Nocardia panacis]